ncbi:protein FAR1-RELATED SEQUENCE 5-like [Henckelia pumila]|uniref:protein FAR1-RELATED SEQUENCE 5-like n=1 Tax=Henckelia pumila TaxID=405737 RepID=UPI003C6E2F3C
MWLFDTFSKTMHGKMPVTILTDQDAAMAKALGEKWPSTYHHLCIWHIYQNAAIHLSHVFSSSKDFAKDFSSCIYDLEEEDDFLTAWQELLNKYDLQGNQWMDRMFKIKEKWSLVYGRQIFCADMTTTQRSESMNSVLKKYVNHKHDLLEFFKRFRRLINDRCYEELKADLRSKHSTPNELSKAHDSKSEVVSESETVSQYKITPFNKQYKHTVIYDSSADKVSCSCKKFEFAGILCSHALKVLTFKNVVRIPESYVKKRWTKQAKKWVAETYEMIEESLDDIKEEDEKVKIGVRYKELCRVHNQLVTRAALTEETYEIVRGPMHKGIEEVDISLANRGTSKQTLCHNVGTEKQILKDDFGEITVKGFKVKQNSRVKSGKRPKCALEKTKRQRKSNPSKELASNTAPFVNDCVRNIDQYPQISSCVWSTSGGCLTQPFQRRSSALFDLNVVAIESHQDAIYQDEAQYSPKK